MALSAVPSTASAASANSASTASEMNKGRRPQLLEKPMFTMWLKMHSGASTSSRRWSKVEIGNAFVLPA